MTLITPTDGEQAVAEHIAQLTETLTGVRPEPVTLAGELTIEDTRLGFSQGPGNLPDSWFERNAGRLALTTAALEVSQYVTVESGKYVRRSDDADNTLEWRGDGFFVPPPPDGGISDGVWVAPSGTLPKLTVSTDEPPSPTAGDLWVDSDEAIPYLTQPDADALYLPVSYTPPPPDLSGYLPLAGGTLAGHLLFTDNTYDIGALGGTRPRSVYARGVIQSAVGTTSAVAIGGQATDGVGAYLQGGNFGFLYLGSGTTPRWQMHGNGHWLAYTDNAYDIGASGANRPRDLFLGRSMVTGGNVGVGVTPPTNALRISAGVAGGTAPAGFGQILDNRFNVGTNVAFDGANWNRIDPAKPGLWLDGNANNFSFYFAPAGANPISGAALVPPFTVGPTGNVIISGSAAAYDFPSRDTGAAGFKWYAQAGNAFLYDNVKPANRIQIGPTGTLTLSPDAGVAAVQIGSTPQPKITVAASAPSSPMVGDLWIW